MYDLIIIGLGPAGYNAAVYAARFKMKVLLIGEMPGGMTAEAVKICNFISYQTITGADFTEKMEAQVRALGVEPKYEKVLSITKKDNFEVKTNQDTYLSKKIVLALGSEKRKMKLENESQYLGKGISYCATCDAAFFREKIVGIVGGGDSALTAALLLSEFAKKVFIFYRKDSFFRAEPSWVDAVENNKKIESVFSVEVTDLQGKDKLESIKISNNQEIKLDGLFIEIGTSPNTVLAKQLGVELDGNFIKVDKYKKTNIPGVFAAGDITNGPLKQIVTAAADGAIATTTAYKEIKESK